MKLIHTVGDMLRALGFVVLVLMLVIGATLTMQKVTEMMKEPKCEEPIIVQSCYRENVVSATSGLFEKRTCITNHSCADASDVE